MSSDNDDGESLSWNVRLSDNDARKTLAVWLAAVTCAVAGIVVVRMPLLGLVGFVIILASTAEHWLGVRYSLGPKGASARCGLSVSAMTWEEVRRVQVGQNAVKLSPLEREGRLDPFRGVTLRFTPENRERVLDLVRSYCGQDVRLLGI